MIHQISPIKTKTERLPVIGRAPKARRTKSRPQFQGTDDLPTEGYLFSPIHAGPYLVPITRWIE
jgi:hypothetical protein